VSLSKSPICCTIDQAQGSSLSVSARSCRGRVYREKVSSGTAEARTGPSSTPRLAPGRPTRCDTSYAGGERTHLLDERAFDPMDESAVFAWSSVHDRGGAHSAEADDFPPAMAVAPVRWVSQMATNTIGSSISSRRASARLAACAGVLPQRRCYRLDAAGHPLYTERTGETLGTVGSASSGGPSC
jgi:hypothetical protein